ncbi:MAG: transcriptional regulator, partial [Leptolyngbya sp.]
HLKTLREAGLISARQDGRGIYYRLTPAEFGELEDYLSALRCLSPQIPACPCPPDRL